ncbi:N-terminal acetyltransferase, partial [Rhizophlyctis rosea]
GTTQPKFWFYQYRNTPDAEWNTYYGFPEMSLGDHDLEMMNYWTSRAPESFQRNMMILVKFLREEVGEGKDGGRIVGKVMLANGLVKRNLGGKTELVKECRTEEERVEALRERFGIELTQEQRDGIRGYVTELKETGSGEESEPGQR